MKTLDFTKLQKFMKKNSPTLRSYDGLFKLTDSHLFWSEGYIVVKVLRPMELSALSAGIYTVDCIPSPINYPNVESVMDLRGNGTEVAAPISFGQAIAPKKAFECTICLDGQVKLGLVCGGISLHRANLAVELGCSKCEYYSENELYVFSSAADMVTVYAVSTGKGDK